MYACCLREALHRGHKSNQQKVVNSKRTLEDDHYYASQMITPSSIIQNESDNQPRLKTCFITDFTRTDALVITVYCFCKCNAVALQPFYESRNCKVQLKNISL